LNLFEWKNNFLLFLWRLKRLYLRPQRLWWQPLLLPLGWQHWHHSICLLQQLTVTEHT